MKREFHLSSRREFFGQSTAALAVLNVIASQRMRGAEKRTGNPFAYDISRLEKTDPKLIAYEQILRWKAPHPEAKRLAIGHDDTVYICSGNYLTARKSSGERGIEITFSEPPRCAAATMDGTIFVGLRNHIEVLDANGARKATWDSPGKKPWFTGLAVTKNDVFAADAGNRVILRYDKSGKIVCRIGEKDREHNIPGFIIPSPFFDVEMAPDGLLRVNNPGRHRVEAYTVNGDFEGSWGTFSTGIAGFCGCCNPINIALFPDGRFVTCEKGLPRVKIYGATGKFECVVAGVETFVENGRACSPSVCTTGGLDAVVDSQGRIIILDFVTGDVRVMKRKA